MKNQHTNTLRKAGFVRLAAMPVAFLSLILTTSDDVHAQANITSFELAISSSELVLEQPDNHVVMHYQSWDSPLQRILERNMPFLEVRNNANSTANITEVRLTIGDTDFNFTDDMLGRLCRSGRYDAGRCYRRIDRRRRLDRPLGQRRTGARRSSPVSV